MMMASRRDENAYVNCVFDGAHDGGSLDGASGVGFGSGTQRFEDGTSSSAAASRLGATGRRAQIVGTRFPTGTVFYHQIKQHQLHQRLDQRLDHRLR